MTGLPPEIVEKAVWDAPWPWPLSEIEDWVKGVVNTILSWLRSVADWVWDKLRSAWDWILRGIYDVVSWIWDKLQTVAGEVKDRVEGALREAYGWIQTAVSWALDNLGKVAEGMASKLGEVAGVLGRALDRIWDVVKNIGATIMDAVGSVLSGLLHGILDFLRAIAERIWDAVRWMASKVEAAFSWVLDRVRDFLSSVWNALVSLMPKGPEDIPDKLPKLMAILGLVGIGTFLALDAAETKILGSGLELDGLKSYLKEVFSPGLIQGVLIGAVLSQGYGPFIARWVRSTFRTWIPEPTEAYVLWRQGYISAEELRGILAQHGTPEKWMAARVDLCDYTPPMRELLTVGQYTDLDLEWLTSKLRENGVAPGDEAKYKELFTQMSLRRVHGEIWSAIYTAISYGVPPRDAVDKYLTDARLRAYLRPYYLMAYDIRLNTARVRWWLEAYEEQVYRGLIEPGVALEKMLGLGVDKSYAMARIAYQMARRGVLWEPPTQ
jgi:uncharacterized protein YjbJ (UPF0337 family)